MKETIGANPFVSVGELYGPSGYYYLDVKCSDRKIAEGHAVILKKQHTFGNIRVAVRVLDQDGLLVEVDPASIPGDPVENMKAFFHRALDHNAYFTGLAPTFGAAFAVEVRADLVQVWSDNISNPYGLSTYVANEAFAEFLNASYPAGTATFAVAVTSARKAEIGGNAEGFIPLARYGQSGGDRAFWNTDVWVYQRGATSIRFYYYPEGATNPTPVFVDLPLNAPVVKVVNIVGDLFRANGRGSIRFRANGRVKVVSRTWTRTDDGGTSGMIVPAVSAMSVALGGGDLGRALSMLVDQRATSRASLGLVNVSGVATSILVEIFDARGNPLPGPSSFSVDLGPYGMTHIDDLWQRVGSANREGLLVRAHITSPGGAFVAYLVDTEMAANHSSYFEAFGFEF